MELLPLIVFFIQAVSTISGQKCQEIPKCQYSEQAFADAHSQGDVKTLCPLLTKTVICKTIALHDCIRDKSLKESAIEPMQQSLDRDNQQRLAFCGTVPEDGLCDDLMRCDLEISLAHAYVKANMISEACGVHQRSVRCLRSSYDNCKERKILQIVFNETIFENFKNFLKKNCGNRKQTIEHGQDAVGALETSQAGNLGVAINVSSMLLALSALLASATHQFQL